MTLNEAKELFPEVSKEKPENAIGYIYVTFEPISGKFYIGKKTDKRWKESYYGWGHYPVKWKNEGLHMEHWPILWCYSKQELANAEINLIDKFKYHIDIVNMVNGGGDTYSGGAKPISDEISKKFSQIRKLAWEDENMRNKYINGTRKYYANNKGNIHRRPHTEEVKAHLSEVKANMYRKERTDYVPKKFTNKQYHPKKVLCVETGEIFDSITEAALAFDMDRGGITRTCMGKQRTGGGLHWEYVDTELSENDE